MPVNTNYSSWKVLQRVGLRVPSTSLRNLGHHPPLSPRGLFSHLSGPQQPLGSTLSTLPVCMLGSGVILVPGASSFAPLLLVLLRLYLLCQPPGQACPDRRPWLLAHLLSCFALVFLLLYIFAFNVVLTVEPAFWCTLFFLGHNLSSCFCTFGESG